MSQYQNVFDAIHQEGHDENFLPHSSSDFSPTDAPPGSDEKIQLLRKRIVLGMPLWHEEDRTDHSGRVGSIAPRRL